MKKCKTEFFEYVSYLLLSKNKWPLYLFSILATCHSLSVHWHFYLPQSVTFSKVVNLAFVSNLRLNFRSAVHTATVLWPLLLFSVCPARQVMLDLSSWPGIQPMPLEVEAWHPNCRTARRSLTHYYHCILQRIEPQPRAV